MNLIQDQRRSDRNSGSAVWTLAFRPFFLSASLWAALALAVWIFIFAAGAELPSRFDPLTWHIHAMLFGFVMAAIAGFMLTAIPNWTGRAALRGAPLASLVGLWTAGRIACLFSNLMPLWSVAVIDLGFPAIVCGYAVREIVAARNWRNLMMPVPLAVLGAADLLIYVQLAGFDIPSGLGWRLALAAVITLISAVGGRIIPSFTKNWLVRRGSTKLPVMRNRLDPIALATLHTGLIGWAFVPSSRVVGGLLLVSAVLNFYRLARWRALGTLPEPLLAILHLGYLWLVIGVALLGATAFTSSIPEAGAVHALTTGAIGTMIVAVMTRVSRGHTGRPLEADRATTLIYLLIALAAVTRVAAAFAVQSAMVLLKASAGLWVAGFLLFALLYGPMLIKPRR